jgi:hypothetical protein
MQIIEVGALDEPAELILLRRRRAHAWCALKLAFCSTVVMGLIAVALGFLGRDLKVCPGVAGRGRGFRVIKEDPHCLVSACGKEFEYYPVSVTYNISGLLCGLYCDSEFALENALNKLPLVADKVLPIGLIVLMEMASGLCVCSCLVLGGFSLNILSLSHQIKRKASEAPLQIPLLPRAPRGSGDSIGTHSAFDAAPCGSDL